MFRALLLSLTLAFASLSPAFAGDPSALGLRFDTIVRDKRQPQLVINNTRDIRQLSIAIRRDGKAHRTLKAKNLGAGSSKNLPFPHGKGDADYDAQIDVTWGDGEKDRFTLSFSAQRLESSKIDIGIDDVNLDTQQLRARLNNPATKIEASLIGQDGSVLEEVASVYESPVPAGDDLHLQWTTPADAIMAIRLKVHDIANFWVGLQITPFSIEIPHEELVFDLGASSIRADQRPKLDATWTEVQKALKAHGTLLDLNLFIAGYTDTVGDRASNRRLSQQRARAIAAFFRQKGLRIPIFYTGYGEDVLAVPTPDETPEEANRRAIYILSTHTPVSDSTPKNQWHRL